MVMRRTDSNARRPRRSTERKERPVPGNLWLGMDRDDVTASVTATTTVVAR
jgi:hypothetical protein